MFAYRCNDRLPGNILQHMNEKKITIFIAGDSTAAIKTPESRPETGWGEKLPDFFLNDVRVENHAVNGRSSKSFFDDGRLAVIDASMREGDYLFIQFGHNDMKIDDPVRYIEPVRAYKEYLMRYISSAREKRVVPVLLTSVERRIFSSEGRIERTLAAYQESMRELSRREALVLLDIGERSREFFERLGAERSKELFMHFLEGVYPNFPDGKEDNTHFRESGARAVAQLVAGEIRQKLPNTLGMFLS